MLEDVHANVQVARNIVVCGCGRNSVGKYFTRHSATEGSIAGAGLAQREMSRMLKNEERWQENIDSTNFKWKCHLSYSQH